MSNIDKIYRRIRNKTNKISLPKIQKQKQTKKNMEKTHVNMPSVHSGNNIHLGLGIDSNKPTTDEILERREKLNEMRQKQRALREQEYQKNLFQRTVVRESARILAEKLADEEEAESRLTQNKNTPKTTNNTQEDTENLTEYQRAIIQLKDEINDAGKTYKQNLVNEGILNTQTRYGIVENKQGNKRIYRVVEYRDGMIMDYSIRMRDFSAMYQYVNQKQIPVEIVDSYNNVRKYFK